MFAGNRSSIADFLKEVVGVHLTVTPVRGECLTCLLRRRQVQEIRCGSGVRLDEDMPSLDCGIQPGFYLLLVSHGFLVRHGRRHYALLQVRGPAPARPNPVRPSPIEPGHQMTYVPRVLVRRGPVARRYMSKPLGRMDRPAMEQAISCVT